MKNTPYIGDTLKKLTVGLADFGIPISFQLEKFDTTITRHVL